ncbi:MAG: LysM peptidoglycan-binding domain-containing protein [Gemmatimonadota bacterium]
MKRSSSDGTRGRIIAAAALVVLGTAPLLAQQPQQAQQREHVVKRGDTLWDLARAYLNNPFLWPMIYEANRQVVENPHRIYPAERLVIPPLPGEMRPTPEVQPPTTAVVTGGDLRRTRFYMPEDTSSESTLIGGAPPVLYRVQPREYHAAPWLADSATLNVAGWVFKSAEPRNDKDKLSVMFHPFDRLHIAYAGTARARAGDLMLVVSLGRKIPGYGRVIEPVGVIRIDSLASNTMMGMVTHQFGGLTTGDLVIPMDSFPANLTTMPVSVSNGPQGEIIDFLVPQPVYGTQDVSFVSLGSASGIKVGDELASWVPARRPEADRVEQLPPQDVARLLVMRVTGQSATVRVIHLQNPVLRTGLPVRVIARMP